MVDSVDLTAPMLAQNRKLEWLGTEKLSNDWHVYLEGDEFYITSVNPSKPRLSYGFHVPSEIVAGLMDLLAGKQVKAGDIETALTKLVTRGMEVPDPRPDRLASNISPLMALLMALNKVTAVKDGRSFVYTFNDPEP